MTPTHYFIIGLFVFVFLAILIFDIYIIKKSGKQESISAYMKSGAKKYPLLNFLLGMILGILIGHILWSMDTFEIMPKETIIERCKEFVKDAAW